MDIQILRRCHGPSISTCKNFWIKNKIKNKVELQTSEEVIRLSFKVHAYLNIRQSPTTNFLFHKLKFFVVFVILNAKSYICALQTA